MKCVPTLSALAVWCHLQSDCWAGRGVLETPPPHHIILHSSLLYSSLLLCYFPCLPQALFLSWCLHLLKHAGEELAIKKNPENVERQRWRFWVRAALGEAQSLVNLWCLFGALFTESLYTKQVWVVKKKFSIFSSIMRKKETGGFSKLQYIRKALWQMGNFMSLLAFIVNENGQCIQHHWHWGRFLSRLGRRSWKI